eukprot:2689437-Rhodomonas_salina.2
MARAGGVLTCRAAATAGGARRVQTGPDRHSGCGGRSGGAGGGSSHSRRTCGRQGARAPRALVRRKGRGRAVGSRPAHSPGRRRPPA